MTHHNHKHSDSDRHSGMHERESSADKKLHKDWRVWLAVGVMLAAMTMYVLTLDESIVPAIMGR